MTLLEVLVVLGIMGLILAGGIAGVSRLRKSDLRAGAARVGAALRSAYDRAAASGAHHRVLLDLDEETFQLERCEGKVRLRRSLKEAKEEEQESLFAQAALVPGSAEEAAQRVAEASVGQARCTPVKGELGKPQALPKPRGIGLAKIYVGHLEDPALEGKVPIHFFPQGYAERAVVEVAAADGDTYSLVVHPLTGRVEITEGVYRRPDEFVREDAEGKTVTP
jgi:hypothetical protein